MNAATETAPLNLTIAQLKRFNRSRKTALLRAAAFVARADAKRVRSEVDALLSPIFAGFHFVDDDGVKIETEGRLWLCDDDTSAWDRTRHETLTAAGYDTTGERCPALVAESNVREAIVALMQHATEQLGIDFVEMYRSGVPGLSESAVDLMLNPPTK
jgi:hypothetical protein